MIFRVVFRRSREWLLTVSRHAELPFKRDLFIMTLLLNFFDELRRRVPVGK
jgi:hypothetical protein